MAVNPGPVRVLFVAGQGRSGSTLLSRVLAEHEGVVAVGEVRHLWRRGLVEGKPCECGVRVPDCPFWGAVLDRVERAVGAVDAGPLAAADFRAIRARRAPTAVLRLLTGRRGAVLPSRLAGTLAALYAAIADVAGARVVVDSSKSPLYADALRGLPAVDVRLLHLVRDPRAAAYSWQRVRWHPDRVEAATMALRSPLQSAGLWLLWNALSELLWRGDPGYLRLRYEDFAAAPAHWLPELLRFAGAPIPARLAVDSGAVVLRPRHTVSGNPNRFEHGRVQIRLDDEWRRRLRRRDRTLVAAATAPLRLRYGYHRSGAAS